MTHEVCAADWDPTPENALMLAELHLDQATKAAPRPSAASAPATPAAPNTKNPVHIEACRRRLLCAQPLAAGHLQAPTVEQRSMRARYLWAQGRAAELERDFQAAAVAYTACAQVCRARQARNDDADIKLPMICINLPSRGVEISAKAAERKLLALGLRRLIVDAKALEEGEPDEVISQLGPHILGAAADDPLVDGMLLRRALLLLKATLLNRSMPARCPPDATPDLMHRTRLPGVASSVWAWSCSAGFCTCGPDSSFPSASTTLQNTRAPLTVPAHPVCQTSRPSRWASCWTAWQAWMSSLPASSDSGRSLRIRQLCRGTRTCYTPCYGGC